MPQVDILFCYFGIRKFATHWVSLGFFCMLVPLSTFTPEVRHMQWGRVLLSCHPPCAMQLRGRLPA
jgi:beta-mannan synthase